MTEVNGNGSQTRIEVHEIHGRLSKVEQQLEDWHSESARRGECMERLEAKIDKMEHELARYRGFVGGILLVVTAIGAAINMFGDSIHRFFFDGN